MFHFLKKKKKKSTGFIHADNKTRKRFIILSVHSYVNMKIH